MIPLRFWLYSVVCEGWGTRKGTYPHSVCSAPTSTPRATKIYAVNSIAFHHMNEPVRVRRGELVRIYLVNILEYDPINSFHVHGNFFEYFPTGTRLQPVDFTEA